jgi:hypothetical protein
MNLLKTAFLLLLGSTSSLSFAQQTPEVHRQYIYSEQWDLGTPSGYFGAANGSSLKVIQNYDIQPYAGKKCVRIKGSGKEAWAGFLSLSSGHWLANLKGDKSNLVNLSDYEKLIVHIRAEKQTKVNLGLGENIEPHTAVRNVEVGREWKKVTIPVGHLNLKAVNGVFSITLLGADTIYLDEIYLEAKPGFRPPTPSPKPVVEHKPIKVTVQKKGPDQFELLRGGKPYYVKGAGGHSYLDRVKEYGGNSIRTWSHENADAILDSAHKHGLTVMFGLWVQHERHGFDYNDEEAVYYQLQGFKEVVQKYKNHPALLLWGIGNEVDLFYSNTKVWYAIQDIAKMIHEEDPNHPTTTVTAGLDAEEIRLINERCPDIDIMSINTYGDLENVVPDGIRKAGWKGAYMITEWGPTGHWEIDSTDFDIPIEQTSSEKSVVYRNRYQRIASDKNKCVGSYVFLWGNKQETTPTWYSMFLEDGSESEILDVMQYNWAAKWPANRAPSIASLTINGKKAKESVRIAPGAIHTAEAMVKDPENKPLKYQWVIMPESTDKKSGGDFEATPEALQDIITEQSDGKIKFKTPAKPGAYRLFVYAYDDVQNVAYANIPFFVTGK